LIDVGRAGEFIAATRIELGGWRAVPATADAVDIVAMSDDGRVLRVQVKSTRKPYTKNGYYYFGTCRGRHRRGLTKSDCDIVAMVALDLGRCVFRRVEELNRAVTTRLSPDAMSIEAEAESFQKSFGDGEKQ
jgi:hypothetical protein